MRATVCARILGVTPPFSVILTNSMSRPGYSWVLTENSLNPDVMDYQEFPRLEGNFPYGWPVSPDVPV